jgi:cell division ATPase FtsA
LVGGGAKLPGLVDFTRDELELPARLGSWKHIHRVVDGMDELTFAPAVGLMLLDMYLGPAGTVAYFDAAEGLVRSVNSNLNSFINRLRKPKN